MAFGTFDLFHPGHEHYLREAAKLWDELIVIVARDARVLTMKLRSPIHTELTRLDNVVHAFPEAMVLLGDEKDMMEPLRIYAPDIIALWYDQFFPEERVRSVLPNVWVVRIDGFMTDIHKSSLLRQKMEHTPPTMQ